MSGAAAVAALLDRLAPDQRAAATAPPGPVLCVAPAGSGKTTTLVARIAWLVDRGRRSGHDRGHHVQPARRRGAGRPPGDGAASRSASRRARCGSGPSTRSAARSCATPASRSSRWSIGSRSSVRSGRTPTRPRCGASTRPSRASSSTSPWTRRPSRRTRAPVPSPARSSPTKPPWRHRVGSTSTTSSPARSGCSTERPDLLERWRARCAHLLVDEVQDVDRSQLRLALLLASPANRIFLVGDDDQTIYGWRLADVRRVIGLAAELPGLRRVDLVTNYRCPRPGRRAGGPPHRRQPRTVRQADPGPARGDGPTRAGTRRRRRPDPLGPGARQLARR